jgi:hypothetical protein
MASNRLRQLEDQILRATGNRREQVVALAADGTVLFEKEGDADRVSLTRAELDTLRNLVDILTHNHPSGIGIGMADFDIAVDLNVRELHAFTPDIRYRIVRPATGWPLLAAALPELDVIRRGVRRRLNAEFRSGAVSYEGYGLRYWHEVWMRYAHKHPELT